jgi:pyruvate formate-lyase activating enzyme-like uncharacterized protein
MNQDEIYANERQIETIDQAIAEAQIIAAEGMGITGGEPILELERTLQFIRAFKETFGPKFHIHLYTGVEPLSPAILKQLLNAGLDELRLHRYNAGQDLPELRKITKGQAKLGIEIPIIPSQLEQLKQFLLDLDEIGIDFVNLNELEFSPLNAKHLQARGFKLNPESIAAVQNSEATAIALIEWAAAQTTLNIHFCPLALKDGVQLRNRFRRRAKHVAKPFEQISEEGLLIKGVLKPPSFLPLSKAFDILTREYGISPKQLWINTERKQIEMSVKIAKKLASELKGQDYRIGIVEEHPTEKRLQVTYTPL